ncbi:MAG: four helix bundle protein [Candidatus Acidoferrales bacterium]
MPGAKRFEDLRIWQRARALANLTYRLTGQPAFRDAALRNQMRRAAVSVMSNIAEGFGRGSNEELDRFLFIAKGSAAEVLSQLYLSLDLKYISQSDFQGAKGLCEEPAGMILAFSRSMKAAGRPGFRRRRKPVSWRERVEEVMKEIEVAKKEENG